MAKVVSDRPTLDDLFEVAKSSSRFDADAALNATSKDGLQSALVQRTQQFTNLAKLLMCEDFRARGDAEYDLQRLIPALIGNHNGVARLNFSRADTFSVGAEFAQVLRKMAVDGVLMREGLVPGRPQVVTADDFRDGIARMCRLCRNGSDSALVASIRNSEDWLRSEYRAELPAIESAAINAKPALSAARKLLLGE